MKTVLKSIVLILVALTVTFYGGAYLLPGEARVERSAVIAAPPDKVFAVVGNLRRVPEWSPWLAMDPAVKFSFDGPEQGGIGQVMRWASNNPMVGNGGQTVLGHEPDKRLIVALNFGEFGSAQSEMELQPAAGGTLLTLKFRSPLPGVVDRWAGLFMDAALGEEMTTSLSNIKHLVEAG
ncbi:MAG: SRPBCC family protein [Aestuariivirga sp.]|uniref:SRPBCC family protein n=1 Tax=Aestuariivirga sp. TaxID=2650926 RepID=UPI0038D051CF